MVKCLGGWCVVSWWRFYGAPSGIHRTLFCSCSTTVTIWVQMSETLPAWTTPATQGRVLGTVRGGGVRVSYQPSQMWIVIFNVCMWGNMFLTLYVRGDQQRRSSSLITLQMGCWGSQAGWCSRHRTVYLNSDLVIQNPQTSFTVVSSKWTKTFNHGQDSHLRALV